MTVIQAAKRWGVTRQRVYWWLMHGRLKIDPYADHYDIQQADPPEHRIAGRPRMYKLERKPPEKGVK